MVQKIERVASEEVTLQCEVVGVSSESRSGRTIRVVKGGRKSLLVGRRDGEGGSARVAH